LFSNRGGDYVMILLDGTVLKGRTFAVPPPVTMSPFAVGVRLLPGQKRAKRLAELTGKLTVETSVDGVSPVVFNDILKAAGKSAPAADGSTLTIQTVETLPNKHVQVQVTWAKNVGGGVGAKEGAGTYSVTFMGNQMTVQGDKGTGTLANGPQLLDADGRSFTPVEWKSDGWLKQGGNDLQQTVRLIFRPQQGQGPPARLVWTGQRAFTFDVPFTLKDIVLP